MSLRYIYIQQVLKENVTQIYNTHMGHIIVQLEVEQQVLEEGASLSNALTHMCI